MGGEINLPPTRLGEPHTGSRQTQGDNFSFRRVCLALLFSRGISCHKKGMSAGVERSGVRDGKGF